MLRQEVYALDGTDRGRDSLHCHRAELHDPSLAATGRQSPCRLLHPRPRSDQLPLRAQPGRSAHQPRADAGGGRLRQRAERSRHRLRTPPAGPHASLAGDRDKQTKTLITYTENGVTNPIDDPALYPDDYRASLPCETRTFELTGYPPTGAAGRFQSGYPHHKIKTGERKLTCDGPHRIRFCVFR